MPLKLAVRHSPLLKKQTRAFQSPSLNLENPFHTAPDESEPDSELIRHFVFRGSLDIEGLALDGINLNRKVSKTTLCEFFDTWVWSLWFKNAILAREGTWVLQRCGEKLRVAADGDNPKFAEDFPESRLRQGLKDLTNIRALRKTASVRLERHIFEACNASGKLLARLSVCRIAGPRSNRIRTTLVEIHPARGAMLPSEKIGRALIAAGCRATHENLVQEAYKICKTRPAPYSIRLHLDIAPETHARTALLEIFTRLLSIARQNEHGIAKNIDTEFLHDFRVALRKLRSVAGQLKGVFPDELAASWKRTIGDLCRTTNALRDYDVYLLSRRRLEGMIPVSLRSGLKPFFEALRAKRELEARNVADFLGSADYRNQIDSLQREWADLQSMQETADSSRPILQVAGERILKRFRSIRKAGKSITARTPDSVIHELRIECKKLRYLLECFSHLFPADTVHPLARQLSKLQNRLGRYNDTSMQQSYLLKHAASHLQIGDTQLALALGALIGSLHHEHAALRKKLLADLDRFTRGANAKRASSLIHKDEN